MPGQSQPSKAWEGVSGKASTEQIVPESCTRATAPPCPPAPSSQPLATIVSCITLTAFNKDTPPVFSAVSKFTLHYTFSMKPLFFLLFIVSATALAQAPAQPATGPQNPPIIRATVTDSTANKFDSNGNKHGLWQEQEGASRTEGTYDHGKKEGCWKTFFNNGQINLLEEYHEGKRSGIFLELSNSGTLRKQIQYKDGAYHGTYRQFNSAGRPEQETGYRNGQLSGPKKIYYANGKLLEEGTFENNLRQGNASWYYENGKTSVQYLYKDGELDGVQRTFSNDGFLSTETVYKKNAMDGDYREFFEDGKTLKLKGQYNQDKKTGTWFEYNKEGKVTKTERYKEDVLVK
jgi:antitoxin component YwqK of YwqJK toxin-antitoxin module